MNHPTLQPKPAQLVVPPLPPLRVGHPSCHRWPSSHHTLSPTRRGFSYPTPPHPLVHARACSPPPPKPPTPSNARLATRVANERQAQTSRIPDRELTESLMRTHAHTCAHMRTHAPKLPDPGEMTPKMHSLRLRDSAKTLPRILALLTVSPNPLLFWASTCAADQPAGPGPAAGAVRPAVRRLAAVRRQCFSSPPALQKQER